MMKFDDLRATIERLQQLREEYGRSQLPFEIQAVCIDRFGLDGYRQLEQIGVTDVIAIPWLMDGVSRDAAVQPKRDSLKKFADQIISHFSGLP
jgi:hypothetical protein